MNKQFTLITMAIIAMIGIWAVIHAPDEAEIVEPEPHFVDAYVKDFTLVAMDENGLPYYTLTADLMEHFNDTGEAEITQPIFSIDQDAKAWVISARNGVIDDNNEWVTLNDDVVMLQKDSPTPLELTTSQLRYNTRTQVANTDKEVNITQGSLKVRSRGLSFDNSTGILELLKDVNGTYVIKNQ